MVSFSHSLERRSTMESQKARLEVEVRPTLEADVTPPPHLPLRNRVVGPFVRCFRAACEWLAHTFLALVVICCMAAVEWAVKALVHSPRLFDIVPIAWLFHGADVAVLVGLSSVGVRAAIHAYREADER